MLSHGVRSSFSSGARQTVNGLLAMGVYFAYNDTSTLTMAQSLWNLVFQSQVQPDQSEHDLLLRVQYIKYPCLGH